MRNLAHAGWMTVLAALLAVAVAAGPVRAETVYNGAAGNAGDSLENTFHFQSQNIDVRLAKPDGSLLSQAEAGSAYGQAYKIFSNGEEWVEKTGLQPVGADLSGANWINANYPILGQVAVDPASGRFKFAAAGWNSPTRLNPMAMDAGTLSIALNDQGQALCARVEKGAAWHKQVCVNFYDPQSGWQGAVPVDYEGNSKGSKTFVALNNTGLGLCLFSEVNGGSHRLFLNTFQVGTGWQGAVLMDQAVGPGPTPRGLALNDYGAGALFFTSSNHLWTRRLDPMSGWADAETIDSDNQPLKTNYDMAINASGQIVCAFSQSSGAYYRMYVTTFQPAAGTWSAAVPVDAATGQDADYPSIAINSSGMIACAFQQPTGECMRQYVNLYLPGSGWQGPQIVDLIANTALSTAFPMAFGDVLVEDTGHVVCAFSQANSPNAVVLYAREYRTGPGWLAPTEIASSEIPAMLLMPRLGNAEYGRLLCIYSVLNPSMVCQAVSQEYLPASGWGPATNFGPLDSAAEALAVNRHGSAVAGLVQGAYIGSKLAFGCVYRVESPGSPVTVNYSYQSLSATAAAAEKRIEVTGRELKPLQNRKALIAFDLDQPGWVSVQVYSLRGERVRTLVNQYYAAGQYAVEWGGENDASQLVASGVYIIHVKTPGLEKKQKVVVVK
ncbi:MAG: hypothetical protein AB1439_07555 [candidate division FCPU426 bacterium]